MNPKAFVHHDTQKRQTYESLKQDYDSIKSHMKTLANMGLSEETYGKAQKELESQINEIKERMHNYIDKL